jgi:hypothetical protein
MARGLGRRTPGGPVITTREDFMSVRDTAEAVRRSAQDPLGIYLNDHLAGATAGVELARRVAKAGQLPADQETVRQLAAEITEDRAALMQIMRTLGIPVRGYKVFAAWAGEKAGRLKPNGRIRTRSPLSSLEELEILRLGVEGKVAVWRTLRAHAGDDPRLEAAQLDELTARAGRQAEVLDDLHRRAAAHVLASSAAAHG